jgi:hypothetical protein
MEKLFFNCTNQAEAVGVLKLLIFDKVTSSYFLYGRDFVPVLPFLLYFQIDAVDTQRHVGKD